MSDDHLSVETSVSGELTETGLKASAKSRTIASIDRLFGGAVDIGSALLEGYASRRRAINEGERQLIEATAKYGLERLGHDQEFAERAFKNNFKKIARAQINKDAVVAEALLDLREQPPTEEEASAGPESVSEEFMARFEHFAEGATTEELRSRWGRVLASEIRRPGTFSPKVLRATEELDAETAKLFERLCRFRFGPNAILKPLVGELEFLELASLVSADLIVEPGITGHNYKPGRASNIGGESLHMFRTGRFAAAVRDKAIVNFSKEVLIQDQNSICIPIFILTDVGCALSTILDYDEGDVFRSLVVALRGVVGDGDLLLYERSSDGNWRQLPDALFR